MDPQKIREEMEKFSIPSTEEPEKTKKPKKAKPKNPKHVLYFEGELQLRNITPEITTYVIKRVYDAGEFIAKQSVLSKTEVDYQISSKSLIRKIVKELQNKFGGTIKESEQHFSQNRLTSKNIYRVNAFYKRHEHIKNDIVKIDDSKEPWRISSFKGEHIIVSNTQDERHKNITTEKIIEKIIPVNKKVIQVKPTITILDNNFQPAPLITTQKLVMGQNVRCVECNGAWYSI